MNDPNEIAPLDLIGATPEPPKKEPTILVVDPGRTSFRGLFDALLRGGEVKILDTELTTGDKERIERNLRIMHEPKPELIPLLDLPLDAKISGHYPNQFRKRAIASMHGFQYVIETRITKVESGSHGKWVKVEGPMSLADADKALKDLQGDDDAAQP